MKLNKLISYLFENVDEAMRLVPPDGTHIEIDSSDTGANIVISIVKDVPEAREVRKKRENYMQIVRTEVLGEEGKYVWEVQGVKADHGYGPMLYDIAMEIIYLIGGAGLMPDRDTVSDAARAVWAKYYNRKDINKKPLPKNWFEDEEIFLRNRPNSLRYYYSKRGAPLLKDLKAKGLVQSGRFNLIDIMSYIK